MKWQYFESFMQMNCYKLYKTFAYSEKQNSGGHKQTDLETREKAVL